MLNMLLEFAICCWGCQDCNDHDTLLCCVRCQAMNVFLWKKKCLVCRWQ